MSEKETTQTQELATDLAPLSITNFEHAQRVAKALSSSNLIPQNYQGNIPNTLSLIHI